MKRAKRDLYIGFVKARSEGDLVPDDQAAAYGWEDYLEDDGSSGTDETPKPAKVAKATPAVTETTPQA